MNESSDNSENGHSTFNPFDGLALMPPSFEQLLDNMRANSDRVETKSSFESPIMSRLLVGTGKPSLHLPFLKQLAQYGATVSTDESGMELLTEFTSLRRNLSIAIDAMPTASAIEHADSIELQLFESATVGEPIAAALPIDLRDFKLLRKKLAAIRKWSDGRKPVGVSLPKGNIEADLTILIQANVDFVIWLESPSIGSRYPSHGSVPDPWLIRRARSLANQLEHPSLTICLEANIRDGIDGVKALALGATQVSVDHLVQLSKVSRTPQAKPQSTSGGLLGDIGLMLPLAAPTEKEFGSTKSLKAFWKEIEYGFAKCGKRIDQVLSLQHLVALDANTARLTGSRLLEIG